MDVRWLALPAVGAAIGWVTNHLAVRMLFLPRKPLNILGLKIQGLVPRRRTELARRIAEIIEGELLSHEDIRSALADPTLLGHLRERLDWRVEAYLREKARRSNWFVGLILEGDAVGRLKDGLLEVFMAVLPAVAADVGTELERHVDIQRLIVEKVEAFDLRRLEEMVYRIARRELRHIELVGGALGFLIGLVQVLVLQLLARYA